MQKIVVFVQKTVIIDFSISKRAFITDIRLYTSNAIEIQ